MGFLVNIVIIYLHIKVVILVEYENQTLIYHDTCMSGDEHYT